MCTSNVLLQDVNVWLKCVTNGPKCGTQIRNNEFKYVTNLPKCVTWMWYKLTQMCSLNVS